MNVHPFFSSYIFQADGKGNSIESHWHRCARRKLMVHNINSGCPICAESETIRSGFEYVDCTYKHKSIVQLSDRKPKYVNTTSMHRIRHRRTPRTRTQRTHCVDHNALRIQQYATAMQEPCALPSSIMPDSGQWRRCLSICAQRRSRGKKYTTLVVRWCVINMLINWEVSDDRLHIVQKSARPFCACSVPWSFLYSRAAAIDVVTRCFFARVCLRVPANATLTNVLIDDGGGRCASAEQSLDERILR